MPTILTVGEILVEIMAARRGQTFTEAGTFTGPYASGAPAIFIDQVARLGAGARMVSRVGDDGFGQLNRNRLSVDGVDVRFVGVDPDVPTGIAFVTYAVDGSRSFLFTAASSAAARLTAEHVVPAHRSSTPFSLISTFDEAMHQSVFGGSVLARLSTLAR